MQLPTCHKPSLSRNELENVGWQSSSQVPVPRALVADDVWGYIILLPVDSVLLSWALHGISSWQSTTKPAWGAQNKRWKISSVFWLGEKTAPCWEAYPLTGHPLKGIDCLLCFGSFRNQKEELRGRCYIERTKHLELLDLKREKSWNCDLVQLWFYLSELTVCFSVFVVQFGDCGNLIFNTRSISVACASCQINLYQGFERFRWWHVIKLGSFCSHVRCPVFRGYQLTGIWLDLRDVT